MGVSPFCSDPDDYRSSAILCAKPVLGFLGQRAVFRTRTASPLVLLRTLSAGLRLLNPRTYCRWGPPC